MITKKYKVGTKMIVRNQLRDHALVIVNKVTEEYTNNKKHYCYRTATPDGSFMMWVTKKEDIEKILK